LPSEEKIEKKRRRRGKEDFSLTIKLQAACNPRQGIKKDPVPVPGKLQGPSASSPFAQQAVVSQERNRQELCQDWGEGRGAE
jgi:hypothetical protein